MDKGYMRDLVAKVKAGGDVDLELLKTGMEEYINIFLDCLTPVDTSEIPMIIAALKYLIQYLETYCDPLSKLVADHMANIMASMGEVSGIVVPKAWNVDDSER